VRGFWVDQGRAWEQGLRVKDAQVASKRRRGCPGSWKHERGRGSSKTLGRARKGTAEGEEGSHDLPRGCTENLGSAREPRKRRIRAGNGQDTTFKNLTPRRADFRWSALSPVDRRENA
jgi:hypothetical protein